jgi:hypothetical protein
MTPRGREEEATCFRQGQPPRWAERPAVVVVARRLDRLNEVILIEEPTDVVGRQPRGSQAGYLNREIPALATEFRGEPMRLQQQL